MTKLQTEINNSAICDPNSALPEGWRWVRLGDVCEVRRETLNPQDYPEEKFYIMVFQHLILVEVLCLNKENKF